MSVDFVNSKVLVDRYLLGGHSGLCTAPMIVKGNEYSLGRPLRASFPVQPCAPVDEFLGKPDRSLVSASDPIEPTPDAVFHLVGTYHL